MGVEPKEFVSTTSQPTVKNLRGLFNRFGLANQ
jgi:hypothetical protein